MSLSTFRTDKKAHVFIHPITLTPRQSASFRCIIYTEKPKDCIHQNYYLEGDDYARWGSDDDYIKNWICDKEPYIGRPAPDVDANGNVIITTSIVQQDDNRSVHNDADVAKIETLQSELESQKTKLNQIMSLLGKNNLI